MLARLFAVAALLLGFAGASSPAAAAAPKDIRWGTCPVGCAGHKALVALAALIDKEMPAYRIAVLPLPGAINSVKGYAVGQLDAFYASQVAFHEYVTDSGRFKGFRAAVKHEPIQAFWGYTLEAGIGIRAADADKIKSWSDLAGRRVFTCPLPFDFHAHLERAFAALGIKHRYVEVDLSTAGSQLRGGLIDAMCVYVSAKTMPAPWLADAALSVDWAALNPTADELARMRRAGLYFTELEPKVFRRDIHADHATLTVVLSGFGMTPDMPADDLARMLTIVEKHAGELAQSDPSWRQLARDMVGMQRRGIATSDAGFRIHPGLAKYLRDKGAWDPAWDARVYKP
jgi:TRAP-type uncharacterized transport system substrate-binding protein